MGTCNLLDAAEIGQVILADEAPVSAVTPLNLGGAVAEIVSWIKMPTDKGLEDHLASAMESLAAYFIVVAQISKTAADEGRNDAYN